MTTRPPLQRYVLSAWARRVGLNPRQARYAIQRGDLDRLQIPPGGRVERTASGQYAVWVPLAPMPWPPRQVALYARAWHRGAPEVLSRQVTALQTWADAHEVEVLSVVTEVAGPFDLPKRLLDLMTDPQIPLIVVANKDALGWLNAPFLSAILESQGRQLLDLGLVEASVREEWSALQDLQQLLSRLLHEMAHVIDRQLPRDPPSSRTLLPP